MKKIIFAASLLSVMLFAQVSNAQTVTGRISVPGFSLRVGNERHFGGYNNGYGRGFGGDRIAMQEARVRDAKRMAWADGHVSYRERSMIAEEQQRLDYMIDRSRGYRY